VFKKNATKDMLIIYQCAMRNRTVVISHKKNEIKPQYGAAMHT